MQYRDIPDYWQLSRTLIGKKPVNKGLVGVVDPTVMELAVSDGVNQHAVQFGAQISSLEGFTRDDDCSVWSSHNIDNLDQVPFRPLSNLSKSFHGGIKANMIARKWIVAKIVQREVRMVAFT